MKKILPIALFCLAVAGLASAQPSSPSTDVLGAHLNYGRGCAACHAPHSGAYGNGGAKTAYAHAGVHALWGQERGSRVGQTLQFGDSTGGWTEPLPGLDATTPDRNITECLSCHDGNLAKGAMMKNAVFETLPSTYGKYNNIPTLLGADGTTTGNYLNDHPVGLNAKIGGGGTYDWDCTIVNGAVTYPAGTKMYQFVQNYARVVTPPAYNGNAVVTCTSCHHQHVMNVSVVKNGAKSGLPSGN